MPKSYDAAVVHISIQTASSLSGSPILETQHADKADVSL